MADQYENAAAYGSADAQRNGAAQAQGAAQLGPGPPGCLAGCGGCHADFLKSGCKSRKYRENIKSRIGKRSEEHTSELQSLMRISYAVFCLKKKKKKKQKINIIHINRTAQVSHKLNE